MSAYEFDNIAQNVFLPIYDVISSDILSVTKIYSGTLLDIGCGGGHLGLSVLKKAENMKGILMDNNIDAVNISMDRIKEWKLCDRAEAAYGDVLSIPLPDKSIDLIVSRSSIGFWSNLNCAFSEIIRVLKPNGRTYIGSGMGNKEVNENIMIKMKKINPEWPDCVHKISNGYTVSDYAAALDCLNADYEIIKSKNKGKWVIIHKE